MKRPSQTAMNGRVHGPGTRIATALCALLACGPHASAADPPRKSPPVRVLVTQGGHGFAEDAFYAMLDSLPGITCERIEVPGEFARLAPGLEKKVDVILRYDMLKSVPVEQAEAFARLLRETGIGLVGLHHNLGAHRDWPEYREILGGAYLFGPTEIDGKRHEKSGYKHYKATDFRIAAADHPVTRGLKPFTISGDTETYSGCYIADTAKVLVTTDQKKSNAEQAWVHEYGKSRVTYILPGHGPAAYKTPGFRKLLARSLVWAARKEVD